MSIVDDMFYELFEIADLYRSGLEEALDQDLARNLVKTLVAMSSLSSAHVELIYCQLQGGFGGFDDDFFKGGFGAGPQKSEKLDSSIPCTFGILSFGQSFPTRFLRTSHIISSISWPCQVAEVAVL